MKLGGVGSVVGAGIVAPHAGAWIETNRQRLYSFAARVAPHAGAWIETFMICEQ